MHKMWGMLSSKSYHSLIISGWFALGGTKYGGVGFDVYRSVAHIGQKDFT